MVMLACVVVSLCCLYNVWRCLQLSLSISLETGISENDTNDGDDDDDDNDDVSDLEGAAPTPKLQRLAREEALERSLASWSSIVPFFFSHLIKMYFNNWSYHLQLGIPPSFILGNECFSVQSLHFFCSNR